MTDKDYANYVELGKACLKKIEGHQIKICTYAAQVCTIRHGGISKGVYTLKQYAEDIGIPAKTLQNWMQVYRNVVTKLTEENKEKLNWQNASKVNNILDENRVLDNAIGGTKGTRTAYKKHVEPEKVNKLYESFIHDKPFENEFINICQQTKMVKGQLDKHEQNLNGIPLENFRQMKSATENTNKLLGIRDLAIISDDHLKYLMVILDECSDKINAFLTAKRKSQGSIINAPKNVYAIRK